MKRNLELQAKMDELIQRILAAGLMKKWILNSQRQMRNDFDCKKTKTAVNVMPLSLQHWSLGFVLFFGFALASFLTFFIELTVYKKFCANKSSKFWNWANLVLTGKRTFFLLDKKEKSVSSNQTRRKFSGKSQGSLTNFFEF